MPKIVIDHLLQLNAPRCVFGLEDSDPSDDEIREALEYVQNARWFTEWVNEINDDLNLIDPPMIMLKVKCHDLRYGDVHGRYYGSRNVIELSMLPHLRGELNIESLLDTYSHEARHAWQHSKYINLILWTYKVRYYAWLRLARLNGMGNTKMTKQYRKMLMEKYGYLNVMWLEVDANHYMMLQMPENRQHRHKYKMNGKNILLTPDVLILSAIFMSKRDIQRAINKMQEDEVIKFINQCGIWSRKEVIGSAKGKQIEA